MKVVNSDFLCGKERKKEKEIFGNKLNLIHGVSVIFVDHFNVKRFEKKVLNNYA